MGRSKNVIDANLAERAREELGRIRDAKVCKRLQAIASCERQPVNVVAVVLGVSRRSIWQWAKRYKEQGLEGLRERPRGHRPPKLSSEQLASMERWLAEGRNDRGEPVHWTLTRLQVEISEAFGVRMGITALWKRVRALGFRQKVPRPRHRKSDVEQQEAFKKNR